MKLKVDSDRLWRTLMEMGEIGRKAAREHLKRIILWVASRLRLLTQMAT